MKQLYLFLFFIITGLHGVIEWEIIIPTYNNEQWCIKNIARLAYQTYPHWHATVIIDAATDRTEELLREYIAKRHLEEKITLIVNAQRQGALANIYHAVTACPAHKVVGLYDGDDRFPHNKVLEYLTHIYETEDVWMTYGQFKHSPENRVGFCRPYPARIIKQNSFRSCLGVLPSHFRTFYAGLFHRIAQEDLMYEGEFFPVTWDLAIMFPLIEMAGVHHKCIKPIMYIYNTSNPLNDFKLHFERQMFFNDIIRAKKRYKPLRERPREIDAR